MPVPEREVVQAAGGDLFGCDHDLVAIGSIGDREGRVEQADVPCGALVLVDGDVLER